MRGNDTIRARAGQSWSMDLVIAVVVFGFIAVVFYSLLTIQQQPSIDDLQGRAQTIEGKLAAGIAGCGPLIENQSMTMQQLQCLYKQNVTTLREQFGVPGSFCIYVEDTDGTILIVQNASGSIWTAVGDSALIVAGQYCGTPT